MTETKTPEVVEEVDQVSLERDARLDEAFGLVRRRMFWSVGVGLVPVPIFDLVALTGLQVDMIRLLAKQYDLPFKKEAVKSIVGSLIGSVVPVGMAGPVAYALKNVPIVGYTLGAVSMSILSGAATYAIGWVFIQHFEAGGNLGDFDTEKMREEFKSKFDEGKKVAEQMKKGK